MSPSPYSGGSSGSGGSGTPKPAPISTSITIQTPDDEDDDSDDDEDTFIGATGYSTMHGDDGEGTCLHCGDGYTITSTYIGYYCPECRPPDGFTEDA